MGTDAQQPPEDNEKRQTGYWRTGIIDPDTLARISELANSPAVKTARAAAQQYEAWKPSQSVASMSREVQQSLETVARDHSAREPNAAATPSSLKIDPANDSTTPIPDASVQFIAEKLRDGLEPLKALNPLMALLEAGEERERAAEVRAAASEQREQESEKRETRGERRERITVALAGIALFLAIPAGAPTLSDWATRAFNSVF